MSLAGLVDVIHWLEDVFDRLQLRRSYGGAIAYNYYGPPRLKSDARGLLTDESYRELEELVAQFA